MTLRRAVAWALVAAATVAFAAGLARGSGVRWFWLSALASIAAVAVTAVARTEPDADTEVDDPDDVEDEDEEPEPEPVSADDLVALPEPVLLGQLPDLDLDQLEELYEREQLGPNRATVLNRIEELAAFPIVDYDQLDADEIVPLLDQLEQEELELVRERERAGAARAQVLDDVARLLDQPLPADVGEKPGNQPES